MQNIFSTIQEKMTRTSCLPIRIAEPNLQPSLDTFGPYDLAHSVMVARVLKLGDSSNRDFRDCTLFEEVEVPRLKPFFWTNMATEWAMVRKVDVRAERVLNPAK